LAFHCIGDLITFNVVFGSRIAAMTINTNFLVRCIHTLEEAFTQLQGFKADHSFYDIFRAASVKEFELILEQSGKLLRKRLRPFFASNRQVDRLTFKDVFRHAVKHDLISVAACERWFAYREHRNDTAHEYGERFAEAILELLPDFISDAKDLARVIAEGGDD
jgi:nucleotidyltransferase substrate binding protein (TIGR01987 family)